MKKSDKYLYLEVLSICEKLRDKGIQVDFSKDGIEYIFGIRRNKKWEKCICTENIRTVLDLAKEAEKEVC